MAEQLERLQAQCNILEIPRAAAICRPGQQSTGANSIHTAQSNASQTSEQSRPHISMLTFLLHGRWETQARRGKETDEAKKLEQHGRREMIYKGCFRDAVPLQQEGRVAHEHAGRNGTEPCTHSTRQEAIPRRREKAVPATVIGKPCC